MKTTTSAGTPVQTPTQMNKSTPDFQEQIRRRAYELYEQRGSDDGHDLDDWLQAESEVTPHRAKTAAV
jgi:Protein of unknown function (DUF2934)